MLLGINLKGTTLKTYYFISGPTQCVATEDRSMIETYIDLMVGAEVDNSIDDDYTCTTIDEQLLADFAMQPDVIYQDET